MYLCQRTPISNLAGAQWVLATSTNPLTNHAYDLGTTSCMVPLAGHPEGAPPKGLVDISSILICLEHPNWSGFCLATVGHQHHRHQNVCLVEERCGQRIAPIKIPSANQPQQNQAESKGPCSFKVAAPTIQLQSIGQRDTQTSSVLGISLPTTNQPRVLNVNEHIKLWSSSSYHIIKPLLCFSDL